MRQNEKIKNIVNRFLSPSTRMKVYAIPYRIVYWNYARKVDINKLPLFQYIEIETINRCNGTCSFCPVNVNEPQRPYAKMTEELFHKIIDELHELNYKNEVKLYSNNEPFLDSRILEFMKYAREQLPNAYLVIYTNGSMLDIDKIKETLKYLDILVIDNYSLNGHEIPENLKRIKEYCDKNIELYKKVKIMMRKKDEILTSRGGQAPNIKDNTKISYFKGCFLPFKQMIVRPDGKCSLCCNDALGKYTMGDLTKQSMMEVWYSDIYMDLRNRLLKEGRKGLKLCDKCDTHIFV